MARARRSAGILLVVNTVGGKQLDESTQFDGWVLVYDATNDQYTHIDLSALTLPYGQIKKIPTHAAEHNIRDVYTIAHIGDIESSNFVNDFEAALI